ncbi:MAG: thymidylate kinase [Desulfurococcaceae archaeon]
MRAKGSRPQRLLVALEGPDGSGKTTLARLLLVHCSSRGIPARSYWLRGSHLLASLLLRLLSRFEVLRGPCNPYYWVCVPAGLRGLWAHVEFWSLAPRLVIRGLLSRLGGLLVSDRGALDFVVWVVVTLGYPGFVSSLYGRFLLGLARRELVVYLRADPEVLEARADVPREFLRRECAVYEVLSRHYARASLDTGRCRPAQCLAELVKGLRDAVADA